MSTEKPTLGLGDIMDAFFANKTPRPDVAEAKKREDAAREHTLLKELLAKTNEQIDSARSQLAELRDQHQRDVIEERKQAKRVIDELEAELIYLRSQVSARTAATSTGPSPQEELNAKILDALERIAVAQEVQAEVAKYDAQRKHGVDLFR